LPTEGPVGALKSSSGLQSGLWNIIHTYTDPQVLQRTILRLLITMASTGSKGNFTLPDWVGKFLECPVCLETIKDPPIYLCEKGHGLCQTCREPLKAQNKPCPECRGKLTDARNVVVENILEQLPKIKCRYDGCAYEKSDAQLVKKHEEDCRERPVTCEACQEPISLSKLFAHLDTEHNIQSFGYTHLGQELKIWTSGHQCIGFMPLGIVNNDLEFILNWAGYDKKITMFWISLCGAAKEANEYEFTIKLENKAREKVLTTKTRMCLSCDLSHDDVKKKATALLLSQEEMKEASEDNEDKLYWTISIKKN